MCNNKHFILENIIFKYFIVIFTICFTTAMFLIFGGIVDFNCKKIGKSVINRNIDNYENTYMASDFLDICYENKTKLNSIFKSRSLNIIGEVCDIKYSKENIYIYISDGSLRNSSIKVIIPDKKEILKQNTGIIIGDTISINCILDKNMENLKNIVCFSEGFDIEKNIFGLKKIIEFCRYRLM